MDWKKKTLTITAMLAVVAAVSLGGCGKSSSDTSAAGTSGITASTSGESAPAESSESDTSSSDVQEDGSEAAVIETDLRDLKPVTADDVDIAYDQYYEEDELTLEITEGIDAVKSVHFLLFLEMNDPGEEDEFVYLGEDNNLVGDWDTGIFTNNFSGFHPTIGVRVVTIEIIEETEKYNLYSIPCIIDGEETSIRALYNFDTEKYRILGRYDGVYTDANSNMTSRGVRKIDDGAQVVFTLPSFEGEDAEEYEYQMDPVTWSDDVEMKDEDLGDGIFLFMYEIEDAFGNEINPDPAELEIEGDMMQWITELQ